MVNDHFKGLYSQRGQTTLLILGKWVIATACVLWLAHSTTQLAVMLSAVTNEPPLPTSIVNPSNSQSRQSPPPIDISALKSIALFKEVVVNVPVPEPEVEPEEVVVETKLNLVLKGLFTTDDANVGQAIIAHNNRDQLYQVEDEIDGLSNVTLSAVHDDRIVLNNRGSREVLYLYPEGERIAVSSPVREPIREEVDQAQAIDLNNPSVKKLSEMMRVVRERDKTTGDMLGFRILPGRDRDAFARSGLQANDIITSIDGNELTDLRTAMAIYREKRDASEASLIINRQGNQLSLDINLDKLSR